MASRPSNGGQPRRARFGQALILAGMLSLAAAGPARAHALGAECRVEGGRVVLEAYFSDDTPARDAGVTVRDGRQDVVARGRTDEAGRWSFARPPAGTYRVEVDAGAGHRTAVELVISPTPAEAPEQVSTGPSRTEFTRTPWSRIALGLLLIAALALGLRLLLRRPDKPAAAAN